MYISSISRSFSPWFRQVITHGKFKDNEINIATNYINNEMSFKSIEVWSKDGFRKCGKEKINGKLLKLYDMLLPRR
jgi:hypothetical protein